MSLETLLLAHTREILLLVDPQSLEVRAASQAACDRLGYSKQELIGRVITDVECALSDVFFWEEVRQGGQVDIENVEGAYLCANGETLPVIKSIFRVRDGREWLVIRADVDLNGGDEHAEDELANATSRLRATLEATADGILLVDRSGGIVNMNQHFSRLWGLPDSLLMARDDAAVFAYLSNMLDDSEGRQVRTSEIPADSEFESFHTLRLKDGRLLERKSRPARHGEQIIGRVFCYTDVTERMRAQQQLIDARDQAKAASRAKGEFLAMMSHEIRTPMNGIIGMAQMLEMTALEGEQAEYVRTIRASGEALLAIINDILDYSKIEARKLKLEDTDFNLPELFKDVEQLFMVRVRTGKVAYRWVMGSDIPTMVRGDAVRLRQILINLIGNAFKFTAEGEITLNVSLRETSENSVLLHCAVRDTGIGIPADKLEHIFTPFEQADTSTARHYGGTGLGLSICKLLAGMMGGEIGVSSTQGEGSEFWFTLRLGIAAPVAARESSQPLLDVVLGDAVRILVAEDNKVNQVVMRNMLGKLQGSNLCLVEDGQAALEACQCEVFDLVFMDIRMPGMDGLEATRHLRSSGSQVYVIGVSADAMAEDRQAALEAGMDDYLTKPLTLDNLKAAVQRWQQR